MAQPFGFTRPAAAPAAPTPLPTHPAPAPAQYAPPLAQSTHAPPPAPAQYAPPPAPYAAPAPQPPTDYQSMWSGVQSAKDRPPMLRVGHYIVRVLDCALGQNEQTEDRSFKANVEVVFAGPGSQSAVGERAAFVQKLSGKSGKFGKERSKSFVVAAAGYQGDVDYGAFDPQNQFMSAVCGAPNQYLQAFPNTIRGRLVEVVVSRGNPVIDKQTNQPELGPDGLPDYFREYSWSPTPEEQQDQTPKPAWAQPGA